MTEQTEQAQQRCLLIEDDEDMRGMIIDLLADRNFKTDAVGGLVPAVKALAKKTFDLCLLDLHLPDGHGLQLLEKLNDHEPRIPTIVISAYGDTPTAVKALKQGADNFIDKPIDTELLYRAIDEALNDTSQSSKRGFVPPVLIGNSPPVQKLRRGCLQRLNNRLMVLISGPDGAGHGDVVNYFRANDPRGSTAVSSRDLAANDDLEPWREMMRALLNPVAQAKSAVATAIINDLGDIPLDIWEQFARIVRHQARSETPAQQLRLVVCCRGSDREAVRRIAKPAQRLAADMLSALDPYRLILPRLRERAVDFDKLMPVFLEHHCPADLDLSLRYTAKTQSWMEKFSRNREFEELSDYMRQFIHAWPRDGSSGNKFTVPDLRDQDFQLLSALDRFHWNRTKAARFLGLTLRQVRYRLNKMGVKRGGEER